MLFVSLLTFYRPKSEDLKGFQIDCDVDSFLYTTQDLHLSPYQPFSLIPFPVRSNSITSDNGMTWKPTPQQRESLNLQFPNVEFKLSQMPNFEFAVGGFSNKARILCFLPRLIAKSAKGRFKQFISNDKLAIWWEKIVYPAVREAVQNHSVAMMKIPQTFLEAREAARYTGGTFHSKGYELRTSVFPNLVLYMRQNVSNLRKNEGITYFDDFFFHIQMKSLKLSTFC